MRSFREFWNKWRSRANRVVPSGTQAASWLVLCIVALGAGAVSPEAAWVGFALFLLFLIVTLWDFILSRRVRIESIVRTLGSKPQIGLPLTVSLQVTFSQGTRQGAGHGQRRGRSALYAGSGSAGFSATHRGGIQHSIRNLEFDLGEPASMTVLRLPRLVEPGSGSTLQFEAEVAPKRRGRQVFSAVDCRYKSRLGFWTLMHRNGQADEEVLVLPDVTTWRDTVASLMQTLFQEGRHVKRLASGDTDFAYIAEYGVDDDLRTVNWAATARRARLMKNVYEPERGQHIILAIDASRYMGVELPDGKTRLDHAVDCATALAHTAIQMGDSVGVIGFSSEIDLRMTPEKGRRHFLSMVEGLAKLEAKSVQGGYQALFSSLSGRFRRRSLLIVLSEMEGLATDAGFLQAIQAVQQKHPTLFVSLSPTHLQQLLESAPKSPGDASEWASVEWLLEERDELANILHRGSVELIEAPPNHLVTKAVSSYLRRKRRSAL